MYASISFSIDVPVYPERVYRAWLDSYEHAKFTQAPAYMPKTAGETFFTLNRQVQGSLLVATPFDRIVQTWQMAEFPENAPDSTIELVLEPTCTGSIIKLTQNGVAVTNTRWLMQWWEQKYLRPLVNYFEDLVGEYVADMGDG